MELLREELLSEIVIFVELCQKYVMAGKIDHENYCSLTDIKLNFIKYIIEDEADKIPLDDVLYARIRNICTNDFLIHSMLKSVAGK